MMRSLQMRLVTALVISLIFLFALQWLIVRTSMQRLTDGYVASRLLHSTTSLLALVTFSSDGQPTLDVSRLDPLYRRPFSGHYFHLRTAYGHSLRSRSLWDEDLLVPTVPTGGTVQVHATGPKGQDLLVLASNFQKQGHPVTIVVAEDLAPLAHDLWQFEERYVVVSVIILGLLIGIQALIVRLGLLPLARVRRDIARLEQGDIDQLGASVLTEVRPLVEEMNRLLRVLEQRLHRSRHALGNLAHALKTPLTLMIQLAESKALSAHPKVRDQLIELTQILRHRLDRELRRARLAGGTTSRQRLRLAEEVSQLQSALLRIYQDKDLDIDCRVPRQAVFVGDREDMMELLGNLMDNACQWACRRVIVSIQDRSAFLVVVEDDGPGCPPEVLQQLTQRGARVDESMPGHGLGLSIVKDIVEQYDGDIHFGRSAQLGGFQVCVTLPSVHLRT